MSWPRTSDARRTDPADIFGVDLGTPKQMLKATVGTQLTCKEFTSPNESLACSGGVAKESANAPDNTTFWLKSGHVSRIFQVSNLKNRTYFQCLKAFRSRVSQVESELGRPPSTAAEPEPAWVKSLDENQKLSTLAQGHLTMKAVWRLPNRILNVTLQADWGVPKLVVGLEYDQPQRCDSEHVAQMLMDLFPPATAEARVAAAQGLAACKVQGAMGALAAAESASKEKEVRLETIRALGAMGTPAVPQLEKISRNGKNNETAKEAKEQIAQLQEKTAESEEATHQVSRDPFQEGGSGEDRVAAVEQGSAPTVAAPPVLLPPLRIEPGPKTVPNAAPLASSPGEKTISPIVPSAEEQEEEEPASPAPTKPATPPDGTALALTTSLVAGGVWGGGLSLLAQQNTPGVILLVGSAGAVIGGGTAWGLTHFGLRPSPSQALWFANSTAWGTLAGLAAWAGSGSNNLKLKWGLFVGGESLGMGLGVLTARKLDWTPSQVLFANSLVLGTALGAAGIGGLVNPDSRFKITPLAGYGMAPLMVASAVASRYIDPSRNDLHMFGAATTTAALSGGLLAYGLDSDPSTRNERLRGGAMAGLGLGYMGAALLSPFVEVSPGRSWSSAAGLVAGNAIGLGTHMIASPDDSSRWALGAGIGGLALGIGSYIAYPRLHLGSQAPALALTGALYGAGTWGLASAASDNTQPARTKGGLLALGTAGAVAGLVASGSLNPDGEDYIQTFAGAGLGATAGLGLAKLTTTDKGTPEFVGALAGSAAGFAAGAAFSHYARLRAPDVGAGFLGAGYGSLVGALVPTLVDATWGGFDRKATGGLLLGLSGGALTSAALSHVVDPKMVSIKIGTLGSTLGLGMGVGAGLLWPEHYSQPARIGAISGAAAGMLGAFWLERRLHLDEGLRDSAANLGLVGTGLGVLQGVFLAGIVDPSGQVSSASRHALWGGALLGGSAGLASSLVLSKYYAPTDTNLITVALGDGLGGIFGRGLALTLSNESGRKDTIATLAGSLTGLTSMALVEHYSPLTNTDRAAGGIGMAFGGLVGSLAPTLTNATWGGWHRNTTGGLSVGVGGGALAAAALSHAVAPRSQTLAIASAGSLLGLGMGLGTGLLTPNDYSQPARIGVVTGMSAGLGASLLLAKPLHLDEGFGPRAGGLAFTGVGIGIAEGLLLASLIDPSGKQSNNHQRTQFGGGLLGGSAGLLGGLLLSKHFTPSDGDLAATIGGGILGGLFGRGVAFTTTSTRGRGDTIGTMAGSLAGVTATAVMEHVSPLTSSDFLAAGLGASYGGLVGALTPTLRDRTWGGWNRNSEGGLMLGLSGGAITAAVVSHAVGASPRTIGLGALGGLDGVLTGVGVGLLAERDPNSQRGARIGAATGATAGLALGLGLWPRLDFNSDNIMFLSAATAVGGWTGLWSQFLGHESRSTVESNKLRGGLLAGAGATSMLASALLPALHVDSDLVWNALALDGLFSGAGAGVGALVSRRADAPVWGMLGAGSTGLVLGGVLHNAIDFERNQGFLTFAALEGLWAGGWLPYTLRSTSEVTSTDRIAGLAAGGLGAAGLAVVAGTMGTPSSQRLGMASVGSAVGASLAGGSMLLSDRLENQQRVGIMLGGTAVGLGLGALVSPYAPLDSGNAFRMIGGAGLGLGEGIAFAWASRSTTRREYTGAALVGAGLGASLGLATSADAIGLNMQQSLVASGFAAWGAWVGSFAGAFSNLDSHNVVLGGLAATNVGFLAGYGALRYNWVEPRDFGWLSLAGAMGTAAGGGMGAIFSSSSNPRPVLAGLAIGPIVGLSAGALIVPRFRRSSDDAVSFFRTSKIAGTQFHFPSDSTKQVTSADVLAARKPSKILAGLKRAQHHLFDVTNWTPVFGALPPPPGDPNPAPFFMGVSGLLR